MRPKTLLVTFVVSIAVLTAVIAIPAGVGGEAASAIDTSVAPDRADANVTSDSDHWQGQVLYFRSADGAADAGDVYQIRNVTDGRVGGLATEFVLDDRGAALLHTGTVPPGEYIVVDENGTSLAIGPDGVVDGPAAPETASWELFAQSLDATVTGPVHQGENVTTRIVSNRGRYSVVVTSPDLGRAETEQLFNGTAVDIDGDGADDGVRLHVTAFETRSVRVPATVGSGSYALRFAVPDTGETANATLNVSQPGQTASFATAAVQEERGDIVSFSIDLENARTASVRIGSRSLGYHANLTVRDGDSDGTVTVLANTYLAGRVANDDDGVFETAAEGDSVTAVRRTTDRRTAPLPSGDYSLRASVDGTVTDTATLILTNRSLQSISTMIAPRRAATDTVPKLVDTVTERNRLAIGDTLVVRVDATGLSGVLTSSYDLARDSASASANGVFMSIERANASDQSPERVNVSASSLVLSREADVAYVVLDTDDSDGVGEPRVGETYEIEFVVDESSPLTDERESVTDNVTIVERSATFNTTDDRIESIPIRGVDDWELRVSGETTVAPGTNLLVTLRSNAEPSFFKNDTATIQEDGSWHADFRFAGKPSSGVTFKAKVRDGAEIISQRVPGVVAEPERDASAPTITTARTDGERSSPPVFLIAGLGAITVVGAIAVYGYRRKR